MIAEFGATPWGRAWLKTIERTTSSVPNSTLPKARSVVRNHRVHDLVIEHGRLSATVVHQGDHEVLIEIPGWSPTVSAATNDAVHRSSAESTGFAEGDLPDDLFETLRGLGTDIAVPNDQWLCQCPCRSRQHPCTHITACIYALVQAVDERPSLAIDLRSTIVVDHGTSSSEQIALDAIDPMTFYGTAQPSTDLQQQRERQELRTAQENSAGRGR